MARGTNRKGPGLAMTASKSNHRINASSFSALYRFANWPEAQIPKKAIGVYAIWDGTTLMYCGMSGLVDASKMQNRTKYGLYLRLASHASGRLSGDQFCVHVANRLVVPAITANLRAQFARGTVTLDMLTKRYIHQHFSYQYVVLHDSQAARDLEEECRTGVVFGTKPLLNPKS